MNERPRICVLGAGVIGLTAAVCVQDVISDAQVTVIADKFGQETLSDGAAGIFRPSNTIRGPEEDSVRIWAKDAYAFYKQLCDSDAGIKEISGYIFSKKHEEVTKSEVLQELLSDWNVLDDNELRQFNNEWKYGVFFTTLLIECRKFLPWLTKRFLHRGGIIVKKHVNSFDELATDYHVVVNCTGFAAKYLCGDKRLVPIRGQVYKVKAPWVNHFYYDDYDTYIIPGFDTVTLGGTRQFDSFNTEVDIFDSQSIWNRSCTLMPSLKNAVVEREFVGLRPHRDEVRLELEIRQVNSMEQKIVHNYGHGGYGVTLAWGCAKNAAEIVRNVVCKLNKSKL